MTDATPGQREWDAAVQGDSVFQWRIGSYSLRLFASGLRHAGSDNGRTKPMLTTLENRERFAALTVANCLIKMCALHPEWTAEVAGKGALDTDQSARAAETLYAAINGELAEFENSANDVTKPMPAPRLLRP